MISILIFSFSVFLGAFGGFHPFLLIISGVLIVVLRRWAVSDLARRPGYKKLTRPFTPRPSFP